MRDIAVAGADGSQQCRNPNCVGAEQNEAWNKKQRGPRNRRAAVEAYESVNDKVVVPFKATVAPPNALLIPGAWTMTTAAEFEALQPPALVTFRPSVTLPEAPAV